MTARRKLTDAIAQREELSFVFGQAPPEKVAQLIQETQEQQIPCEKVVCSFTFVPDNKPVRHYYDPEELQQWALYDIKPNGIRSPLWLRPHPYYPGKFELVAGLRRFKAATILELKTVPGKVFDWDDRTAFQAAISENANRRDFSALEELDNTLRLLEIQLGYSTEEAVSLLYRMNNAAKGTTNQNVLVSEEAQYVQQVFDAFGKITWQSFVATRLPLLKKPPEILEKIRRGEVHYTKGILIASVKDSDRRQELLQKAIDTSLSVSEIKQQVQAIKQKESGNDSQNSSTIVHLQQRLSHTVQQAKKNRALWSNPAKTKKLEKLLEELQVLLET
ncbi:ParB N-terminal domain-containing protein [Oscillatoria sp. FACHB-1407]|uniref:ParB/RepB/Spo0J family partition protein n=1 Tax=Oscillatoria sp. FACHB-1407 TaxID=2692847 RepID=UPI0016859435|nr:ParB N-terminal domain-containing protein [Oscillatoria sp. FACHB-1407]MBD2463065.1 ParB N-terminal domain-containing protein [Oscillatoria sp. FACHB-1407]